jgi:gliding motility-associated protein GldC
MVAKTFELKFTVKVDENHLPLAIDWETNDGNESSNSKSVLIGLWDAKEKNTLRIDLWTQEMTVDEMKRFFHQNLISMADTFKKATNEDEMAADLKDFCAHFAEKMGISNQ